MDKIQNLKNESSLRTSINTEIKYEVVKVVTVRSIIFRDVMLQSIWKLLPNYTAQYATATKVGQM
jgi:hypothetical protein